MCYVLVLYRFLRHNILLAGLWFDKAKPPMNMFLLPVMKEMRELQENGIMSYSDQILWQGITCRWAWFVVVASSIYSFKCDFCDAISYGSVYLNS